MSQKCSFCFVRSFLLIVAPACVGCVAIDWIANARTQTELTISVLSTLNCETSAERRLRSALACIHMRRARSKPARANSCVHGAGVPEEAEAAALAVAVAIAVELVAGKCADSELVEAESPSRSLTNRAQKLYTGKPTWRTQENEDNVTAQGLKMLK